MAPKDPQVPSILDRPEVYQKIAQDYGVPAPQALPVASNPNVAFRPRCTQLEPVWEPEQTAWVWQGTILHRVPGQAAATQSAYRDLQASGICLADPAAKEVPLVSTDTVLAQVEQALAAEAVALADGMNSGAIANLQPGIHWPLLVLAPFPLVSVALSIVLWVRRAQKQH